MNLEPSSRVKSVRKRKTDVIYKHIEMESGKWYCWTCLQDNKRDADVEKGSVDQPGEWEDETH